MIKMHSKEQARSLAETLAAIVKVDDEQVDHFPARVDISQAASGMINVSECASAVVPHHVLRSHFISWDGKVERT